MPLINISLGKGGMTEVGAQPYNIQSIMQAQVKINSEGLDEDISDTIMRDLNNIGVKLKHVMVPRFRIETDPEAVKELRNWIKTTGKSFGVIFLIMWGGAFVVTVNTKLLGGHISCFQCVCVLGYCIFPIVLAAVVIYFLKVATLDFLPLKLLLAGVTLVWATFSSISFMNVIIDEDKKIIATYPVLLFYLFIAWFLLFI